MFDFEFGLKSCCVPERADANEGPKIVINRQNPALIIPSALNQGDLKRHWTMHECGLNVKLAKSSTPWPRYVDIVGIICRNPILSNQKM